MSSPSDELHYNPGEPLWVYYYEGIKRALQELAKQQKTREAPFGLFPHHCLMIESGTKLCCGMLAIPDAVHTLAQLARFRKNPIYSEMCLGLCRHVDHPDNVRSSYYNVMTLLYWNKLGEMRCGIIEYEADISTHELLIKPIRWDDPWWTKCMKEEYENGETIERTHPEGFGTEVYATSTEELIDKAKSLLNASSPNLLKELAKGIGRKSTPTDVGFDAKGQQPLGGSSAWEALDDMHNNNTDNLGGTVIGVADTYLNQVRPNCIKIKRIMDVGIDREQFTPIEVAHIKSCTFCKTLEPALEW